MLEDFQQDKLQSVDPLPEDKPFIQNKRIVGICAIIACFGLFVFFTGDSWTSSNTTPTAPTDTIKEEIVALRERVSKLEEYYAKPVAQQQQTFQTEAQHQSASLTNLRSLIEQELQETVYRPAANEEQSRETEKETKKYTVKKGDNLSAIAKKFYGSSKEWKKIVDANKDVLGNKQILKPGMTLTIPEVG